MRRDYLCRQVGAGTVADPRRPAVADRDTAAWSAVDGGAGGWMLVSVEATEAAHKALPGPDILALDALGPLRATLAADGIPVADLADDAPLDQVRRRIERRYLLRQVLGDEDLTEAPTTRLSAARRVRLREAAARLGVALPAGPATARDTLLAILEG